MKKGFSYGITANVILLGLTSLFADVSSEIIMPIIPLFITALGAGGLIVGILGGLGDSVSSILQLFSGYWSDKTGKRKKFVSIGYSLSAITKLFMGFATNWIHIFILRPIERIGKGIRNPPRDAILAETTPKEVHGKVFGIHRAMDTAGALIGSILAVIFLALGFTYSKIFFIAAVIAFLAIIPIIFVKEKGQKPKKVSLKVSLKALPRNLKLFILVSTIFALANFSYMFFILRAQQFFPIVLAVMLYVIFNFSYEIIAIPSGMLADKIGHKKVITYGYLLFVFVCVLFALFDSLPLLILGFILYGISHALIIGNQRAFAADLSSKELGTSLGTFHTFISLASLPAGIIAGALWQFVSPSATFYYGAALALLSVIIFSRIKFDNDSKNNYLNNKNLIKK